MGCVGGFYFMGGGNWRGVGGGKDLKKIASEKGEYVKSYMV